MRQIHLVYKLLCVLGVLLVLLTITWNQPTVRNFRHSISHTVQLDQFKDHPNIVVIMTDDQRLDDMDVMPLTKQLIGNHGTTFTNFFVSNSLCCPSRATFLTGQYSHNNNVWGNGDIPSLGGYQSLKKGDILPTWLQFNGYTTIHIGKYLNGYGYPDETEIPPGWSKWYGQVGRGKTIYQYNGYILNENGIPTVYNRDEFLESKNYNTDILTEKAVKTIENTSGPFFLSVAYLAPHAVNNGNQLEADGEPAVPAERHLGKFTTKPLPQPKNFNEADFSDKPSNIQNFPFNLLTSEDINKIRDQYHSRQESLLAVDEGVQKIIQELERTNKLNNTYIFFTSDNGFMQGEHRIPYGKGKIYDEDIRVPLLVRGPGIPVQSRNELAVNIDLAPTIAELTNSKKYIKIKIDGLSLVPILTNKKIKSWRDSFLLEGNNKLYQGVRTKDKIYVEYKVPYKNPAGKWELASSTEQYDLTRDPFEMDNQTSHSSPDPQLVKRLNELKNCQELTCY